MNIFCVHAFFYISNTFISNARFKLAKNEAKAKQHPEAELSLSENVALSLSTFSSKNNSRYSKKCNKSKCVCFNEVIWLMTIKMRLRKWKADHKDMKQIDLGLDMDKEY